MNLLLDTQAWLWMQVEPERFSPEARSLLEDLGNDLLLSAASSWRRLPLPVPPSEYVPSRLESSGVTPLRIEHGHALMVAELPLHHRDPFDRLLIAQAKAEGVTTLTADRAFEPYEVPVIWAEGP
jgi:PIN domain nuclease of toxin-antitoxin system